MPITVQESYQEVEEYQDQEPYTEQEAYTVDVLVTKTEEVCDYRCNLGPFIFEVTDIALPSSREYDVSWSSSEDMILFAIMSDSSYDSFYNGLILKLGIPSVLTLLSGGALAPLTVPARAQLSWDLKEGKKENISQYYFSI